MQLESLFIIRTGKITRNYRNNVKWLRTDEGGEYIGDEFEFWLQRRHIIQKVVFSYVHKSKEIVERLIRTLLDAARSRMLLLNVLHLKPSAEAFYIILFCTPQTCH